jgi:hypothetical protein
VAPKYLIETFGCQMNVHDSERMAGLLEQAGYESTDDAGDADLVVINTCSVRERAEEKLFTRLGELRVLGADSGRPPLVAVAGCVAQQEGAAILNRAPGVADVILGTQAIRRLPMLVEQAAQQRRPVIDLTAYEDVSFPLGMTRRNDPLKAYITIIEGCNEFCSFCVVPYTRGNERMRPQAEILAEVRTAAAAKSSYSARSSITTKPRMCRAATFSGCSRRFTRCRGLPGSASPVRIPAISRSPSCRRCSACRRFAGTSICRFSPGRLACCRRCGAATAASSISPWSTTSGVCCRRWRCRPI